MKTIAHSDKDNLLDKDKTIIVFFVAIKGLEKIDGIKKTTDVRVMLNNIFTDDSTKIIVIPDVNRTVDDIKIIRGNESLI